VPGQRAVLLPRGLGVVGSGCGPPAALESVDTLRRRRRRASELFPGIIRRALLNHDDSNFKSEKKAIRPVHVLGAEFQTVFVGWDSDNLQGEQTLNQARRRRPAPLPVANLQSQAKCNGLSVNTISSVGQSFCTFLLHSNGRTRSQISYSL
jgi:hypothetical protein